MRKKVSGKERSYQRLLKDLLPLVEKIQALKRLQKTLRKKSASALTLPFCFRHECLSPKCHHVWRGQFQEATCRRCGGILIDIQFELLDEKKPNRKQRKRS